MAKILVVGYGNPLRSDDSFGLRAVAMLKQNLNGPEIELIECQQLTPELAERVSRVDLALFVDADTDGVSGSTHTKRLTPIHAHGEGLMHHLDPSTLLGLTQALYKKAPEAILLTCTGECFGYGTQLSVEVAKALPGVVHHIQEIIEKKVHPAKLAQA